MPKKLLECDVMSAIQPTGELHIGKYFGAVKNWVRLQEEKSCIYGIVDMHALTGKYNQINLQNTTNQMMVDLIACGLDPKKVRSSFSHLCRSIRNWHGFSALSLRLESFHDKLNLNQKDRAKPKKLFLRGFSIIRFCRRRIF